MCEEEVGGGGRFVKLRRFFISFNDQINVMLRGAKRTYACQILISMPDSTHVFGEAREMGQFHSRTLYRTYFHIRAKKVSTDTWSRWTLRSRLHLDYKEPIR